RGRPEAVRGLGRRRDPRSPRGGCGRPPVRGDRDPSEPDRLDVPLHPVPLSGRFEPPCLVGPFFVVSPGARGNTPCTRSSIVVRSAATCSRSPTTWST